ncbi:glycosyltransferase [Mariniluteicoccus flavus]
MVLVAVGSRGDLDPFLALAERLVAEGHEAVLVSHRSLLSRDVGGVEVEPVDSDPATLLSGPAARALRRGDLRGLNRARDVFADFISSVGAPTAAVLDGADVVVASTFAMAAVTAARKRGVPVVRAHLWPEGAGLDGPMPVLPYAWSLPSPVRRTARWALRRAEPLLAGFDGWWSGGRLHIVAHHRSGFTTHDLGSLHAYSPALAAPAASPATPGDAVTGWWVAPDPGRLSADTAALLDRPGPPWVFVGFGSMPQRHPDRLLDLVERVCRRLGVRAAVQVPGAAQTPPGSRVHLLGPEPHAALMPRMAAVVHHGGAGTTGAVVRAGVPSVVVPHVADQFFWAHRLHEVGVAPRGLPRPLLTASRLERLLHVALDPHVAARARALGERVREEDGTGAAVRRLESLVGRGV